MVLISTHKHLLITECWKTVAASAWIHRFPRDAPDFVSVFFLAFSPGVCECACVPVRVAFERVRLLPPLWEQGGPVARGVALRLTLQVFALPFLLVVHTLIPQDPPRSPSPLEHIAFYLSRELTETFWRFWSEYTPLSVYVCLCWGLRRVCLCGNVMTTALASGDREHCRREPRHKQLFCHIKARVVLC